jgi:hypothetical protein
MSEKAPYCATCPNRGFLSRKAAQLGLVDAREDCPGTNVVDHVSLEVQTETDEISNITGRVTKSSLVKREDVCHFDETPVWPREQMGKVYTGESGRTWTRNIAADTRFDAGFYLAAGSLDEDPDDLTIQVNEYPVPQQVVE